MKRASSSAFPRTICLYELHPVYNIGLTFWLGETKTLVDLGRGGGVQAKVKGERSLHKLVLTNPTESHVEVISTCEAVHLDDLEEVPSVVCAKSRLAA